MSLQREAGVIYARNGYNALIMLNFKLSVTNVRNDPPHNYAHVEDRVFISNADAGFPPPVAPRTASAR